MSELAGGSYGLVRIGSRYSFLETLDRLRAAITQRGLKLFAVIDHSGEAAVAGLPMPPTHVVLFGSPKGGTPLMLLTPPLAIDLPLKILLAEDAAGAVWLTYTAADFLIARYGLSGEAGKVLEVPAKIAAEAAG